MKQFVFVFVTNDKSVAMVEWKVEATGMLDALRQAKEMKQRLERENKTNVRVECKGVAYPNIA